MNIMKITIEITGGEKDYAVKAATSEPLNDETRLALTEAVSNLCTVTAVIAETTGKLKHMKKKRDDMKERNKSAREYLDQLTDSLPVWVSSAYPGGGKVHSGDDIAQAKMAEQAKVQAQEAANAQGLKDCPF